MPAIRTECKKAPVTTYYPPQHMRNTLGAAACHHDVALDCSNEIALPLADATDASDVKYQVHIEIEELSRKNFLDVLVGGDVVAVDENSKNHDNVRLERLSFETTYMSS
jgi:hypothetical protein